MAAFLAFLFYCSVIIFSLCLLIQSFLFCSIILLSYEPHFQSFVLLSNYYSSSFLPIAFPYYSTIILTVFLSSSFVLLSYYHCGFSSSFFCSI